MFGMVKIVAAAVGAGVLGGAYLSHRVNKVTNPRTKFVDKDSVRVVRVPKTGDVEVVVMVREDEDTAEG